MSRFKCGFTLVEVALFLAVTAALFVGVTVGVQNSIFQQRYNDSVQNFVEFLRRVYSGVANVQSLGKGMSEQAIYGKLITFGENMDLAGCPVNGSNLPAVSGANCINDKNKDVIFVYDVIGKIGEIKSGNTLDALTGLNAKVTIADKNEETGEIISVSPVGVVESYTPRWTAQIEQTGNYDPLTGMLLVVRHPRSGTIYTFFSPDVLQVNEDIREGKEVYIPSSDKWEAEQVDFCINPIGDEETRQRRDVRIEANARNASAIKIMSSDVGNNACEIGG